MKKRKALLSSLGLLASVLLAPSFAAAVSITSGKLVANGYVYSDTGAEAVVLTDTDGVNDDATAFLFLELAGFALNNSLGIYGFTESAGTVTLGNTLEVFSGPNAPITSVTLAFDLAAGTVTNQATSITASGIGKTFGFYLTNGVGQTFYSHTSLNFDSFDHFKIYDTRDNKAGSLLGSDVVLAIEDLAYGGDKDFDDMVAGITDVAPVPEPGTLLLLGSGLAGLAAAKRRKKS